MTISKEIRQVIYNLHDQGRTVKEIFNQLKMQGVSISEKSVSRIVKEDRQDNLTNTSFISYIAEETFDPFLQEDIQKEKEKEEKETEIIPEEIKDTINTIQVIKDAVKEETQKILTSINNDISQSNDKLDAIIKDVKIRTKPLNMSKKNTKARTIVFDAEGLTEQEKRIRRDLIVKIRNYIDCFADNEIIYEICGDDLSSFKHGLYGETTQRLNSIYEEIQVSLNSSKDYEQFMQMFSTGLKSAEFVSNLLLGLNITGLRDEVLEEIDEFDLRQLACELSLSRYISPQKRIMLITVNALLKRILASGNLVNLNNDLKNKLYGYYKTISGYLKRGK